ncbi:solute carrier family 22 member 8-like isoform X2 [Varroa destructor]|uniref:Major facilitator superfamily (MFS) profile domain-containing protein n=1 Tax=Varroa destructor TaxID=109461 RepID=A0A7M7KSG8_VARDE|nr:solute carrier family 22 member 8-like isoform X2 [Varroa destructor]
MIHGPTILITFAVIRGLPSAMMLMAVVFAAPAEQNFRCNTLPGWMANEDQCTVRKVDSVIDTHDHNISTTDNSSMTERSDMVICTAWSFDHSVYKGTTLVDEWDLVCGRRWIASLSQSLYMFGLIFSTTIFSHVADWYGRKRACVISLVCSLLMGVLLACSPSMAVYNILRFFSAVSSSGYYDAATILLVESVSANQRYVVTLTAGLGWTVGMILLPVVSYLVPNWRVQQLVIAAPFVLLLGLTFFIDESPRWLLETGRLTQAHRTLIKVLRSRQKNRFSVTDDITVDDINNFIDDIKTRNAMIPHKSKGTIVKLFGEQFWRSTVVFCYSKMVVYVLWYHLTVSSVTVGLNPFLSFALTSLCELPNRVLDTIVVRTTPRRIAAASAFTITAGAMSVYYIFSNGFWFARFASLVICRLCMDVHGSVQRVHLAELYPSGLRSLIAGFVYTCANLAGLLSPFIDYLGQATYQWVPSVMIVLLCLIGSLAALSVKETFDRDLHEESS